MANLPIETRRVAIPLTAPNLANGTELLMKATDAENIVFRKQRLMVLIEISSIHSNQGILYDDNNDNNKQKTNNNNFTF